MDYTSLKLPLYLTKLYGIVRGKRFTLGFFLHILYMYISHVRKEVSHSDWLFVYKLKTNPRTLLGYNYS